MTIRSFFFEDLETGWRLEPTSFGQINLLVGPSGAGKTRILDALLYVRQLATSSATHSCRWSLQIEGQKQLYTWSGETRLFDSPSALPTKQDSPFLERKASFLKETITGHGHRDQTLVTRSSEVFQFQGQSLPKLTPTESAVALLQSEETISPVFRSFQYWFLPDQDLLLEPVGFDRFSAERARETVRAVEDLNKLQNLTPLIKAYVLEKKFPEYFKQIVSSFQEIFPNVVDLKFGTHPDFGVRPVIDTKRWDEFVTIGIREENVEGWIVRNVSAGMLKVLVFLINLALATPGSVFLVDELENSLGVNCLPDLAEQLLGKSHQIQFILTSHHPQVINKIPPKYWKIVTRHGSRVRVLDAESIPALKTASPLEKFTQLINLPEFEEGAA